MHKQFYKNEYILALLAIILIFAFEYICLGWSVSSQNYFYTDDFSWIELAASNSLYNYVHFLPHEAYNDRPVGAIIIRLLYEMFGLNAQLYYIFLFIIQVLNASFLYFICGRLFTSYFTAVLVSVLFCLWYPDLYAVFWIGAIFDLFCLTFILLAILLYINKKYIFSIIVYYIAIRTNEMAIMLPIVLSAYEVFFKKSSLNVVIKKQIFYYLVLILIGSLYFYLMIHSAILFANNSSPYHESITIHDFIDGLGYYLLQMFNLSKSILYTKIACYIFMLILIVSIISRKKIAFFLISFLLFILPVIFLKNQRSSLYIYVPSVFMLLMVGYFVDEIRFVRFRVILSLILITIITLNITRTPSWKSQQNWMLIHTSEFKKQHEDFYKKFPSLPSQQITIFIIKNQPLNGFTANNQSALRVIYHNHNINYVYGNDNNALLKYKEYNGNKILLDLSNNEVNIVEHNFVKSTPVSFVK